MIEFSAPFRIAKSINEIGLWQGEEGLERKPNGHKMCLQFNTKLNRVVMVKVGVSTVSIEGARKNLQAEGKGWDFDAVKRAATLGIKGMSYRNSPFSGQPLLTEKK